QVATSLGGAVPDALKLTFARLTAVAAAGDFHQFDATVRENYAKPEEFAAAFETYKKARQLNDAGVDLMAAVAYLRAACHVDPALELSRTTNLSLLGFDALLAQPNLLAARPHAFHQR